MRRAAGAILTPSVVGAQTRQARDRQELPRPHGHGPPQPTPSSASSARPSRMDTSRPSRSCLGTLARRWPPADRGGDSTGTLGVGGEPSSSVEAGRGLLCPTVSASLWEGPLQLVPVAIEPVGTRPKSASPPESEALQRERAGGAGPPGAEPDRVSPRGGTGSRRRAGRSRGASGCCRCRGGAPSSPPSSSVYSRCPLQQEPMLWYS
jgi:hypothetical protein